MTDSILLVPKGFLGDLVLLTPVIEALRESNRSSRIAVVCSPSMVDFVRRDPLVSEVIPFDRAGVHAGWKGLLRFSEELRTRSFSVAYSFHRSPRTSYLLYRSEIPERIGFADSSLSFLFTKRIQRDGRLHDVLRSLSLVVGSLHPAVQEKVAELARGELAQSDSFARLRVPDIAVQDLSESVRQVVSGGKRYVVLSPGSAWETKRWDAHKFREIAAELSQRGRRVIVTGAVKEQELCARVSTGLDVIDLSGQTTMVDLVALVRGADKVVCNDSVALHIASATQTPTVVVFCATSPRFGFGPWRNDAAIVEKAGLFCKPCHRHGSRSCPNGTRACMTEVSSVEVLSTLESLPEKRRNSVGGSE